MRPKAKGISDLVDESLLAANQMSELEDQVNQLSRMVDELKQKSTNGTMSPSDLDDLKKKADLVAQNLVPFDRCMTEVVNKFRKLKTPLITYLLTPSYVFEGKKYSPRLRKLLTEACEVISWSRAPTRFETWLTPFQLGISPNRYYLLVEIYLRQESAKGANATTLDGKIEGWNKGKIGNEADSFVDKDYLQVQPRKVAPGQRGRHSINWELAKNGRDLVVGSGSTFSKDSQTYMTLKDKVVKEAIENPTPLVYMWIDHQTMGDRDSPDALILETEKDDLSTYSGESTAVNIETPADISNQPNRVYLRMITPFAYGVRHLVIRCPRASIGKLQKLKDKLPTWMWRPIKLIPIQE